MIRFFTILSLILLGTLNACALDDAAGDPSVLQNLEQERAGKIVKAKEASRPGVVVSMDIPNFSVEQAYALQAKVVSELSKDAAIAGFKGGLTSAAAPQKFALQEPVVGALFASGDIRSSTVKQSDFNKLMLELEFGMVFAEPVRAPLSDIVALKEKVAAVHAVVELPDLAYDNMQAFTGTDLVANNVSAHSFIKGPVLVSQKEFSSVDISALTVRLRHNGRILLEGKGADAMGDQWEAALWLANKLIALGYEIEAGQLLITGALGKMVVGEKGSYQATFAKDQHILFAIE